MTMTVTVTVTVTVAMVIAVIGLSPLGFFRTMIVVGDAVDVAKNLEHRGNPTSCSDHKNRPRLARRAGADL